MNAKRLAVSLSVHAAVLAGLVLSALLAWLVLTALPALMLLVGFVLDRPAGRGLPPCCGLL